GLVGYWPLNEGSGSTAYDNSGWNNNGTLEGATDLPTWTTTGCLSHGSCLNFDGTDDYVNVTSFATNHPLSSTSSRTILLWINLSGYISNTNDNNEIELNDGYFDYRIAYTVNSYDTCIKNSVSAYGCSSSATPINEWLQVAFVYNNSALQIYFNGSSVASFSLPVTGTIGNDFLMYNPKYTSTPSPSYLGSNVYIFTTSLTSAQIQAIYNAEKPQ
ncbi:MAG: hypothetical protein KGJ01_01995, partial [Patescibacteria group bacterium]|nr:hypothetical protein [Patescibacteria group bacterium]